MMTIGKHRIKNHMTMEYSFAGIRLHSGSLVPVDWALSIDLVAVDQKSKAIEEIEYQATISYQKIFFWLDTNLPNIIMVNADNEDDLYIANLSSNIMLYCPDAPYDDTIVELLHSKLTVLAEGNIIVGEIRIKASDTSLQYTYNCSDGDYGLPMTVEEYYTGSKARDTKPWWTRNDGFCFEFVRPEETELTDEELFKDVIDPMIEFNKVVKEASDQYVGIVGEPARIVQVERWSPKKI